MRPFKVEESREASPVAAAVVAVSHLHLVENAADFTRQPHAKCKMHVNLFSIISLHRVGICESTYSHR